MLGLQAQATTLQHVCRLGVEPKALDVLDKHCQLILISNPGNCILCTRVLMKTPLCLSPFYLRMDIFRWKKTTSRSSVRCVERWNARAGKLGREFSVFHFYWHLGCTPVRSLPCKVHPQQAKPDSLLQCEFPLSLTVQ